MKIQPIPFTDRSDENPAEPCAVRDIEMVIAIRCKGVPFGIDREQINEYIAAFLEDREPGLHEDILDRMPDIKVEVIGHEPMALPAGRPCGVCGGFGYRLDRHETPCGCQQGEGKVAA